MDVQESSSFEEIKARLDEIVEAVSDEELPLDEALSLYEEAVGIGLSASRIMEEGIAANTAAATQQAESQDASFQDASHQANAQVAPQQPGAANEANGE